MAGHDLPEGVVTFVFTDIEGSTRLLQETPGTFAEVLDTHRRVLRDAFGAFDGREVNTEGDGCFFAFASAAAAVLAAARAQKDLAAEPVLATHGVKVRIGMHTGEAQRTGHDYVGLAVHHAARVANAGHGGQILLSEATRLLAGDLDAVAFDDLAEHILKDLARPVRIYQLRGPGLDREFPPLRSLNSATTTLPVSRTSFVGREKDLNLLLDDLLEPGLVTLTGPGGTGKTRLAIETAREVRGSLEGAWFVDLVSASDADQVLSSTVTALDVLDAGDPSGALERVCERIGDRPCLIVLDNCEHLVGPVADLAETLLARCPGLRVLATSRDLLGLAHERARRIPPLEIASATELFVDRASRVVSGFAPTDDEREIIEDICRRLDGIPLAIELAAPRLRHFALLDFRDRLGDVFQLLVGSRGRGIQRHQTLQAVVDWSYNLLTPEEQVVLRRLSALSGSFTIDAAEAVAGGEPIAGAAEDIFFRLVDHSLVEHDGAGRYRQLETLRAYGQTKLSESGESTMVRDRHVQFFLEWAEGVAPGLKDNRFFGSLDQLDPEAENLYAALDWAAGQADHSSVLRLVAATVHFATVTSRDSYMKLVDAAFDGAAAAGPADLVAAAHVELGLAATTMSWERYGHHARTALDLLGPETSEPAERDPLRAWALASLALLNVLPEVPDLEGTRSYAARASTLGDRGGLPTVAMAAEAALAFDTMRTGDIPTARAILTRLLESGRKLQGSLWFSIVLFWSGIAASRAADYPTALQHYQKVLPMFRRVSYKIYTQWVLDHLSYAAIQLRDFPAARAFAEEGVALSIESGLGGNLPFLYNRLGFLEWRCGEHAQSARYYELALSRISAEGDPHDHAALRSNLAVTLVACGDLEKARVHAATALEITETLKPAVRPTGEVIPPPVANVSQAVAHLALANGQPEKAAEMLGLSLEFYPQPEPASDSPAGRFRAALKEALGENLFTSALERGAALEEPLRRIREVLESLSTPGRREPSPG